MITRKGIAVCLITACLLATGCAESTDEEKGDIHEMAKNVEAWDIWLVEIDSSGAQVVLGDIGNVTNRPGYDNQPQFLPTGDGFLYSSIRDEYQSDIWYYDLASGMHSQITSTSEHEFSPMPMPSGNGFSTVRVEEDGTQRLWHFSMDGSSSQVLLPDVVDVGYYSWVVANRVAMVIYSEENASLQVGWVNHDESHEVAADIGRSFSRSPVADEFVITRMPSKYNDFEDEEQWKAAMEKRDWRLEIIRMEIGEWK